MPGTLEKDISFTITERLLKEKIDSLQAEVGSLENDKSKTTDQVRLLKDQIASLNTEIEQKRNELVSLGAKIKSDEEAFKVSRANSEKALADRDAKSQEKAAKAEKVAGDAKDLENKALNARNYLVGLAKDLKNISHRLSENVSESINKLDGELVGYIALEVPTAEIPAPPTAVKPESKKK